MNSKKSQVWYMDLLVAIVIVSLAVMLLMSFINNMGGSPSSSLETDAIYISESLMSIGIPANWNASSVKRPGITDGKWRINETKLNFVYSLPQSKLRSLLDVESNFLIEIYNGVSSLVLSGKNYTGKKPITANHVSAISRYVIYNSTVVELRVSSWD